jgi:hypothetical protein
VVDFDAAGVYGGILHNGYERTVLKLPTGAQLEQEK